MLKSRYLIGSGVLALGLIGAPNLSQATAILDWTADIKKIKDKGNTGFLSPAASAMGTFEFNELSDNDGNAAITDYTLLSTSFSVKDSEDTIIYTATISTPANAKGGFENNHGSHDKLEFKDKGTVSSSTGPTLPTNTAFEEIKIKLQDDDAGVWGTTNILDVASIFASLDFSLFEKNEFKLKFKGRSGAKDIKFEGALTSISVSSQSTNSKGNTSPSLAAVPETSTFFLMGLGFAGLGFVRRRRLNA